MGIESGVKAGEGFKATGPVVGVRAEIDGTTTEGPRALGPEDMAKLAEGMDIDIPTGVLTTRATGLDI